MRALFVVSDQGNGHKVRCGALADELKSRGWECETYTTGQLQGRSLGVDWDLDIVDIGEVRSKWAASFVSRKHALIADTPALPLWTGDLLVAGGAGATPEMYKDSGAKEVLAGPEYALLRPEFRDIAWFGHLGGDEFDARNIGGIGADTLALCMAQAGSVRTYSGMRGMEAACVGAPLLLEARNEGEALNKIGLEAGAVVDGLGCKRVADRIEALCA